MRSVASVVMDLAGVALIVGAAFSLATWVGMAVAGVAFLLGAIRVGGDA